MLLQFTYPGQVSIGYAYRENISVLTQLMYLKHGDVFETLASPLHTEAIRWQWIHQQYSSKPTNPSTVCILFSQQNSQRQDSWDSQAPQWANAKPLEEINHLKIGRIDRIVRRKPNRSTGEDVNPKTRKKALSKKKRIFFLQNGFLLLSRKYIDS